MKKRREINMQVPMTPMLDVVFQLLVFFILTFKEPTAEAHLQVNLPSPGAGKPAKALQVLELKVFPGQVFLQGVPRSVETVKEQLEYIGKLDRDQTVLIKTSPLAKANELITVLDLCQAAGLTKLNVVTLR